MKARFTILLLLLVTFSFAANRSYTLKRTLAEGESSSEYSFYQFPTKSFANDTIEYGDSVTFNLYVDYNKHVPVAPVMYVLFAEAGTTDSLKVTRVINYSQISAMATDNLGSLQGYYYKTFKTTATVYDFNGAAYYPVYVADSITSTGLAYPSFSLTRSVLYQVTVIPLKSGAKVKVKDFRFKLYLQPAQFK